jgi:hypothetical protein
MSDEEMPRDEQAPEQPVVAEEPITEGSGLVIIPGGAGPDEMDDVDFNDLAAAPEDASEDLDTEFGESVAEAEPEVPDRPQFTLDELVAEMAGVSAATVGPAAPGEAAPPEPERVDVLAAAMSDTFAEAPAVEDEMWTRAPFWALVAVWAIFAGGLAYLLWPTAAEGLEALMGASLYGILVYGGVALVVIGIVAGMIVRSSAQARASAVDRGIVGRAILLRVLGWTAAGVAVWVIALIAVSFHAVGVIR